jgi:hypothetical protein
MSGAPSPADDLIERTRRVYAECDSYSDEGEQKSLIAHIAGSPPHRHWSRLVFRTRWKRPNWFYFEYRDVDVGPEEDWSRYVIWSTPAGAHSWWSVQPERDTRTTLQRAIAGATGVSGGTANLIPSLLFETGARLKLPTTSGFWGHIADLEGASCLRIPMLWQDNRESALWIDQTSALIRRCDERCEFTGERMRKQAESTIASLSSSEASEMDAETRAAILKHAQDTLAQKSLREFRTESTTTYKPRLNPSLGPEEFAFEPPRIG